MDRKKTTPNMEVCPESLRAMLEYRYIERELLSIKIIGIVIKLSYKTDLIFILSSHSAQKRVHVHLKKGHLTINDGCQFVANMIISLSLFSQCHHLVLIP